MNILTNGNRKCVRSGEGTYDHLNDGADGSHLGGPGVICSCEVLSVVLVCGDERQPGVLRTQSHNRHISRWESDFIFLKRKNL